MKSTTLVALSAMLGTCAFAQEAPTAPPSGRRPGVVQQRQPSAEILKKFDKDGDGKLSSEESKAMRDDRMAQMVARRKAILEKLDADKDGKLSEEERAKIPPSERSKGGQRPVVGQQRRPSAEMLKQFDKDGDGKLSSEESKAMRDERMEARRKAILEKFDTNKDGKIDEAETNTMREAQQKEMLEKYDTDKDGKLSDIERAKIPASERFMGGRTGISRGGAGARSAHTPDPEAK